MTSEQPRRSDLRRNKRPLRRTSPLLSILLREQKATEILRATFASLEIDHLGQKTFDGSPPPPFPATATFMNNVRGPAGSRAGGQGRARCAEET